MALFQLTQPAQLITLAEAKKHLKVDFNAEDTLIELCCQMAQAYLQQETDQWLGEQSWKLSFDQFPANRTIEIPLGPLKSITSIKYLDIDSVEQTLSSSLYFFSRHQHKSRIVLKHTETWPLTAEYVPDSVNIELIGGYKIGANTASGETELPSDLKKALYLLVNHYYEFRELVYTGLQLREFPKDLTVSRMISHYKRVSI